MTELPFDIANCVRRYKPIQYDEFTLYPVLVKEYTEFLIAQPALEVLHQSLPVAMMRIPLLSALYQLDYQAVISGQTPSGLFTRARLALALALRLGEGKEPMERIDLIKVVVDRREPENLIGLRFVDGYGEEQTILPQQYKTLREIIAVQNGVRIESDKANPNIIQAQKDLNSLGANVEANIDDLISAVCALTHADEADVDNWPILKLQRRSESCRRILDYIVCGIGETNGATWKSGNPVPHPFFKRITNGNGLFSLLGSDDKDVPKSVRQTIVQTQNL